jgi:hypothetical protein
MPRIHGGLAGVKYETAAAFDQPVAELISRRLTPRCGWPTSWRRSSARGIRSIGRTRAEFEAGVLQLITAREVRLRDVPVVENDGRESVF